MKRSRLNPRGKKTKEWESARRQLKVRFEAAGITTCEARFPECWKDNALSFAHRVKRRKIDSQEELATCALLCVPCHSIIEAMSPEGMYAAISGIIMFREVQP